MPVKNLFICFYCGRNSKQVLTIFVTKCLIAEKRIYWVTVVLITKMIEIFCDFSIVVAHKCEVNQASLDQNIRNYLSSFILCCNKLLHALMFELRQEYNALANAWYIQLAKIMLISLLSQSKVRVLRAHISIPAKQQRWLWATHTYRFSNETISWIELRGVRARTSVNKQQ